MRRGTNANEIDMVVEADEKLQMSYLSDLFYVSAAINEESIIIGNSLSESCPIEMERRW